MTRIYALLIVLFSITSFSYGKSNIKFGKVSMEEMEMKTYAPDTSASAVVLFKFGAVGMESRLFRRVKILKKNGVNHSNFIFNGLNTSNIKARVYNLENGEIVEENVKKESIFYDRITDDYYAIRLAIPNVKAGTVYDIEISGKFTLLEFEFQEDLPIKRAELVASASSFLRKRPVGEQIYTKVSDNRYVAENVPAFKPEAFINSEKNYISKFEFDLLRVQLIPGISDSEVDYTSNWDAVNDRLTRSNYFGQALISDATYLTELSDEINANYSTPMDKLQAAYKAIQSLQWNDNESLYISDQSLSKTFKEKSGNSAELNFLLIQLLKRLDIDAGPVALSTRENGLLNRVYPSYFKLNYVITRAVVNNQEILMDPSDKNLPAGLLPFRCLNQYGRLLTNGGGQWVDLNSAKGEDESVMYSLMLNDDLSFTGNIQYKRKDYSAYNWRQNYSEFTTEEMYLRKVEEEYPGLRIKSNKLKNIENLDRPVIDVYEVDIKNKVSQAGDIVTIQPFLFEKLSENPFKDTERKYPIDYAYNRTKSITARFVIPNTLTISEIPEPLYLKFPDNSASVFIKYEVASNIVTLTYHFQINKPIFFASEYEYLRNFYSIIIEKQNQPIVLQKTDLVEKY